MRLASRILSLNSWLGVCLGIGLCALPLLAIAVEFKPPKRGIPGRREGAGTRGPACVQSSPNLTALLPQTNLGLTTADYPQFFWYIPQTRAKTVRFELFKGNEQEPERELVYQKTLNISGKPGIMSFALPSDTQVPPLSVGQDYYWTVTLLCNPADPINNIYVGGWVQRVEVEPPLAKQLTAAKSGDRVKLLAENGIWFDTVAALAEMRCINPKDTTLSSSWSELLKSVKLNKVAEQPFSCRLNL
ncbi:protein of unknown function DUF928 [Leptolyngbyaceae cyanobacterium JSC-12]|nr:protein of unknown function DUF928 [Leptolyngbyaceae cyanobacterium JSC-12]